MGKKWNEWIEVEGSESLRLPITIIDGKRDGKTMLISAGVHGAEYIGIETARTLASTLDPQKVKGKIVILLMANPTATYQFQRFFVPEDGKNLNRVFPGKADGTLSERIAHVITEKLQMEADYYIDLHGGDTSEHVMPFVYYNGAAGEEIEKISKWMAEATNLSVRARCACNNGGIQQCLPERTAFRPDRERRWWTIYKRRSDGILSGCQKYSCPDRNSGRGRGSSHGFSERDYNGDLSRCTKIVSLVSEFSAGRIFSEG